jgi:hypothetical protein
LQVISGVTVLTRTIVGVGIASEGASSRIRQLLKDSEHIPDARESKKELLDSNNTNYWINMSFIFLYFVVALYNLLIGL